MFKKALYGDTIIAMNILIITQTLNQKRGYGRFSADLVSALQKEGASLTILVERGESATIDEKPVLWSNKKIGFFINPFIIRFYSRGNQIIHALDGYPYGIYAALGNFGSGKKLIITMQGTYAVEPLYHKWKGLLLKWAYKKADKLVAISSFTKKEVLKKISNISISIITHGVTCKFFNETESPMVAGDYILSVGTLTWRKGYHVSLEAFARLKKDFPNLKYAIVGSGYSGTYKKELDEIISRHHLESDVLFFHDISEDALSNLYNNAKVFVIHSLNKDNHFEGFGLVFLEAGCFKLPVVGAYGSGAEDAIKEGITGFLAPQGSVEKTAEVIKKLLEDENIRKTIGENNFKHARDWPWSRVAKEYLVTYNEVIKK